MADNTRLQGEPVLHHLQDWHAGQHKALIAAGITVTLEHSPPGRDKASLAMGFDADPRLASLIMWDTGETELDLADTRTGRHIPQHYDIHSSAEVDRLLKEILITRGVWRDHA